MTYFKYFYGYNVEFEFDINSSVFCAFISGPSSSECKVYDFPNIPIVIDDWITECIANSRKRCLDKAVEENADTNPDQYLYPLEKVEVEQRRLAISDKRS